jgi:hypothetical protein
MRHSPDVSLPRALLLLIICTPAQADLSFFRSLLKPLLLPSACAAAGVRDFRGRCDAVPGDFDAHPAAAPAHAGASIFKLLLSVAVILIAAFVVL